MCGLAGLAFAMLRIRFTACNLGSGDLEGCFPLKEIFSGRKSEGFNNP